MTEFAKTSFVNNSARYLISASKSQAECPLENAIQKSIWTFPTSMLTFIQPSIEII